MRLKLNASPLEVILFILFVFYLVFQVKTPSFLEELVNSSVGMVVVLCFAVYMFLYTHPIVGILSIFVAYEVIRRSSPIAGQILFTPPYIPTQPKIDAELKAMNPPKERTLEEDVVDQMAPIGKSEPAGYVMTSFKPVAEDVHSAAKI
jgi:hypothetical protein